MARAREYRFWESLCFLSVLPPPPTKLHIPPLSQTGRPDKLIMKSLRRGREEANHCMSVLSQHEVKATSQGGYGGGDISHEDGGGGDGGGGREDEV